MQIMEDDVIRILRNNIQHLGHFHAAGYPCAFSAQANRTELTIHR